ncbi:MAG TPA: TIGR04086 family membrane protein [Candidatus Eisenbergiella merdipullorum]|uniref:TIGR04086 family membrane protein n=1 Tax=Candidatus Eisenbergiella merdipullorum TaxID=2838553 RepID=A0A9D2I7M3_9FIRM|nr:TIGR04086 family membrane protein [Candidatus Eisenbergiella merdipullorum]
MNRKGGGSAAILFLLKCLLLSYLLTGACLMLLALLLYKLRLSEQIVSIAIIVIYVAAVFLAGFLAGKRMKNRRFLWGLAAGLAYFGIMVLVSLAVNHSLRGLDTHFLSTLILCAAGGMLGGMLS